MAFRFVQSKLMVFISIKRWRGSSPAWNSWRHMEETEHLVPADYLWTWGCQIEAIEDQWVRIHLPSLVPLVIAVHPENWPKCQFWPLVIIGGAEKQTARARMIKLTRRNRDAANTQMVNPEPPSSAIMRVGWNETKTMLQSTADYKKILWYYVNSVQENTHELNISLEPPPSTIPTHVLVQSVGWIEALGTRR